MRNCIGPTNLRFDFDRISLADFRFRGVGERVNQDVILLFRIEQSCLKVFLSLKPSDHFRNATFDDAWKNLTFKLRPCHDFILKQEVENLSFLGHFVFRYLTNLVARFESKYFLRALGRSQTWAEK